jgi:hypothetical protein
LVAEQESQQEDDQRHEDELRVDELHRHPNLVSHVVLHCRVLRCYLNCNSALVNIQILQSIILHKRAT